MTDPQLDLFRQFNCPRDTALDDMTNTLTFWDSLPKYHISREQQRQMIAKSGKLPLFSHTTNFDQVDYVMELQPAMIEQDGATSIVYPGETEEIIEEVLRKFLTEQNVGRWDIAKQSASVSFTLEMLSRELRARGKTRSNKEIVRALEVLGKSVLVLKHGKRAICTGTLLTVVGVSRDEYLANPKSRWSATFHPFISNSILNLKYRQLNYATLMKLRSPLARYFYKRICVRYTNADYQNDYHFSYNSLRRDTEFFQAGRAGEHIKRIQTALNDLQAQMILLSSETEIVRGERNKIIDAIFTLKCGIALKDETIAANQNDAARWARLHPTSTIETTRQRRQRYLSAE
ncbi:MAG: hypothetical protein GDA50_08385 [Alphaproteobacteria bacterium GM202ARS2]|nr:hypothetical protein [Alphaproteobacteria bacterium GM202ARS2]